MQILKIYRNYGCLSAERRYIYTYDIPDRTATCWDEIQCIVPDSLEIHQNYLGGKNNFFPLGRYLYDKRDFTGKRKPLFYRI